MGISKRYFAEFSQSFSGTQTSLSQTQTSLSQSAFSQSLSGTTVIDLYKDVNVLRLNLTGVYTTFCLTPSGSGGAKIIKVLASPNDSANPYSMSYGLFSIGAPGGAILSETNGYFFTGVITGGTYQTASLNVNANGNKTFITAGSLCYLSSTNHTGNMNVHIFYRTQVV